MPVKLGFQPRASKQDQHSYILHGTVLELARPTWLLRHRVEPQAYPMSSRAAVLEPDSESIQFSPSPMRGTAGMPTVSGNLSRRASK